MTGAHDGCVTARNDDGKCEFDGKLGAIFHRGIWILYTRANLKRHGGRFVQVATSASGPGGPFGPLRLITIDGYNASGWANIYFAAVDSNPLDSDTIVGLFPVNEGTPGVGNGHGESYIAAALSCDGIHWSALTKLVWTEGIDGRTHDHPVDGLVSHNGHIYFYVHEHVPHISDCANLRKIVGYRLRKSVLQKLSAFARASLRGCG